MKIGRNNMVRVISVHNFLKQDITSIDEVTDVIAVPPDILLLVQSNNTILVKDLSVTNDPGYVIPTIDQVVKIVYSKQGNYIAALENKITRNGTKVSYVRVYINWETLKDDKKSFPMRARIAGRVTPLSQNQQGLEMIEIPTQNMPDYVSSCSISGNLLLSSRNVLSIYNLVIQTHDISKIHFIDFKQLPVDLHLSFVPTRHHLLENVIAVQNDEYFHVFQIKSSLPMCSLSDKEFSIDYCEVDQSSHKKSAKVNKTINYKKLVQELKEKRFSSSVGKVNENGKKKCHQEETEESEFSKINLLSLPVRYEFSTILLEKSLVDSRYSDVFRQNPFTHTNDISVHLISNSSSSSTSKVQYKINNICQYHLVPLTRESVTNHGIEEKFTSLILKPYYTNEKIKSTLRQRLIESDHYENLKCIACFFGTQQEGYLYCFEFESNGEECTITYENYIVYPFTAPVIDVQLNDCFVHAITEAGLETNTMRAAKHLMKKTDITDCPSSGDPVCLIGLHPFVNVLKMTITDNYLTLFAKNEESSWTLYQLKSPDTTCVWRDFLSSAEENKWEAPTSYCELLGEGHLILKTRLNTAKWISQKDPTKNSLSLAQIADQEKEMEIIEPLYKESCALLGEYHILNKNYKCFYCYYTMSGFKISEIIKRIRGLWKTIPDVFKHEYDEKAITNGLIFFLKETLHFYDQKYCEFIGNREEFYNPEIGTLVNSLMDLLEAEDMASISDLVLESVVLREFSTDRILKMLKNLLSKSSVPEDKDALSLALMCIQRDQNEQAKTVLLTMNKKNLEVLLLQYYDLLFATNNSSEANNMFTELSMVLLDIYPQVLATVLSNLLTVKRLLSLSKVLHFFVELMPSGGIRSKNSSCVLRIVLENYFKFYTDSFSFKKFDYKTTEAMKILIRIYLTLLQQNNESEETSDQENTSDALFQNCRYNYLSQMPPFSVDFSEMLSSSENSSQKNSDKSKKAILLKMQSILSFKDLPKECFTEVRNFLVVHTNIYGFLSLQVLCAANEEEVIDLLISFAPQALSQYSKECVSSKENWKYLLSQLHEKIKEVNQDSRHQFFLQQILSEILRHATENVNIEDLIDIIPKDYEETERYLAMAQSNAQANHIKTLIMITGKQLLASL